MAIAHAHLSSLGQADEDLRREDPALWWLAAIVTVIVHALVSMRVWWLRWLMR